MPALSDAEILAALPSDARKKIDNAFDALAGSLPSDKERLILYRVANALKLNPTDTHFSILAAMHYYLQLYQMIPDRIVDAGAQIIAAGNTVDETIRKATREALTEHSRALDAQTELLAAKTRSDLIGVISQAVQKIVADSSRHERQKTFVLAVSAISIFAVVLLSAAILLMKGSLGMAAACSVALMVGGLCGGALSHLAFPRMETRTVEAPDRRNVAWDDRRFLSKSLQVHVSDRVMQACRDVLVCGYSVEAAASKRQIEAGQVARGISKFNQQQ